MTTLAPSLGERERDRLADAAVAAGDDRDLAVSVMAPPRSVAMLGGSLAPSSLEDTQSPSVCTAAGRDDTPSFR